ncbi:MAG: sensor histidine kinase [Faecousia sp.]
MSHPQSHSFRNRLLLSFLIASLVPMVICSAMLSQISRIQMNNQMEVDAHTQTEHILTALDRISDALPGAVQALEDNALLPQAFSPAGQEDTRVNNALFLATEGSRDLAAYSLYNLQGRLCYSTGRVSGERSLSTRWGILFAAAKSDGDPVYMASTNPENGEMPLLQGAAVLKNAQGNSLGYLVMDIYDQNFQNLFAGKYGAANDILILNRYWRPVYASQSQMLTELAPTLRGQLLRSGRPVADTEEFRYQIHSHEQTGLYLVLRQPQVFTRSTMQLLHAASFFCVLVGILISAALCLPLSRRISQPIQGLLQAFSRLEQDDLDVHVSQVRKDELGQLEGEFNHMVSALKANREELVKNQRELNQAQVRMLQAQLNPHFLCNTLDTMKWISKINHVPQVALMSTNLADILRFCISAEEFVPLSREVEVLHRYVEIQKIRLSDQFTFRVSLPEELGNCLVPKMILQPIVENAILHGLEGVSDSVIQVIAEQEGSTLSITVTDNGHGLPPEMIGHPYRRESAPQGHHLGLYNVDTILKKHYGATYGLYLDNNPEGSGARIQARLPLCRKEETEC